MAPTTQQNGQLVQRKQEPARTLQGLLESMKGEMAKAKHAAQHGCRECGAALPAHRFTCSPCMASMLQRELDQFLPAVAS